MALEDFIEHMGPCLPGFGHHNDDRKRRMDGSFHIRKINIVGAIDS